MTSASTSVTSTLKRAFTAKSEWPEKDNFLDVLYWFKQVIGILVGVLFGFVGLTGSFAIVAFAVISAGAGFVYCNSFQAIDEEEYGGAWELLKEGFMTSFAGFMVTWIILYSGLHYE